MTARAFAPVAASIVGGGLSIRFRAAGGSMYPAILDGDVLTVSPVEAGAIAHGDVLLYLKGDRILAHRVVDVTVRDGEVRFDLRGDANGECDEPVAAAQVIGRVDAIERAMTPRAMLAAVRRTSVIMRRYLSSWRRLLG